MPLLSQLPVRLRDLLLARVATEPQDLVVVSLRSLKIRKVNLKTWFLT
jgi:hypothetical protein